MLLLVAAGVNMLVFQFVTRRSVARWEEAGVTPWQGRVAGLLSWLLWIGVVAFGRWIGFTSVA